MGYDIDDMNDFKLSNEVRNLLRYSMYSEIFSEVKGAIKYLFKGFIAEKFKQRYGEIFLFKKNNNSNISLQTNVIYQWLEKYDYKFDKRTKNSTTGKLDDQMFFIVLDRNTFALVKTGVFVSSFKDYSYKSMYNRSSSDDDREIFDDISVMIFGKRSIKYINELKKELEAIEPSPDKLYTYNVSGNSSKEKDGSDELNSIVSNMNCRDINTLFYNEGVKEGILEHIDSYIENESIYTKRNLLHKTGILLYGNPGTGKTSLATALATKYHYDLIIIDMATFDKLDLVTLTNCINSDIKNFVILLEDVDTIYNLNRDTDGNQVADRDEKKIINKMLQFLDSSTSPNNVIFIATSNYPDRLDDAILRAGRFDYKVNIGPINEKVAKEMCESFEVPEKAINEIIAKCKDEKGMCNQSKLQNHILEYFKKEIRGEDYIENFEEEEINNGKTDDKEEC